MTSEEIAAVYALVTLLNPGLFINANIFIVDPNLLLDSSGNQFYKITDETIGVHVNQEIMIGGKTVKVLNVMACNDSWLSKYYYNPLNSINRMISEKNMRYQGPVVTTDSSMISNGPINNAPIIIQEFRNHPISTYCMFCKSPITTRTENRFNFLACCCCFLFGILYICVQACADKNICCCDVIHRCPRCGRILGEYTSC